MSGIKFEGFGALENLLERLPPEVRSHLRSIIDEPVTRGVMIDVIHAQLQMNIAVMTAVVAVAGRDRERMATELENLVKTIEGGSNLFTDAITRLMSNETFRAEIGPDE